MKSTEKHDFDKVDFWGGGGGGGVILIATLKGFS